MKQKNNDHRQQLRQLLERAGRPAPDWLGRSAATELESSTLMAAATTGEQVEPAGVEGPGPESSTPVRPRERPPGPQLSPMRERLTVRLPTGPGSLETGIAAGGRRGRAAGG